MEVKVWLPGDQGEKDAEELIRRIPPGTRTSGRRRIGWISVAILKEATLPWTGKGVIV